MASTLTTDVGFSLVANLVELLDLSVRSNPTAYQRSFTLASGTGAGQADIIFHDQRTLTSAQVENLRFRGTLADPFGATVQMVRLKALVVYSSSSNTTDINLSRTAGAGIPLFLASGDGIYIKPGGLIFWVATDATAIIVTPTTADNLTITNAAGASAVYDIIAIGASA